LSGKCDFELTLAGNSTAAAGPEGESVFTAIEAQLGLKLEPQRDAISILVVDQARKTPND
jgi:uncharacterized protein (TIGR03435 family)